MAVADEPVIRCEGLVKSFRNVRALDGLTLDVPAGVIFGFLGPNGAGKTTTIHVLLGLLDPTSGRAQVLGLDPRVHGDRLRTHTGALLEHHGLYERLTAYENLEFMARVYRIPLTERRARIRELLDQIGLWERRRDLVGTWSKGMKQKLAIQRSLLHRPPLLFLDEPTAGHDPQSAVELRQQLVDLVRAEGTTVFLTTHNLAEAEKVSHQVAVIRKGRVVAHEATESLRRGVGAPMVDFVGKRFTKKLQKALTARPEVAGVHLADGVLRIELRKETTVAPLVTMAVEHGARLEEVVKPTRSLEDAVLEVLREAPR